MSKFISGVNGVNGRFSGTGARKRALSTVSMVALATGCIAGWQPAQAQTAAQTAQTPAVEEIVVTGSRIVRDGYQAPTPLTVVGEEQIQAAAPKDIADYVNQLPALANSVTPQSQSGALSNGAGGINSLNLRGIGTARTLVLLDGQRSVPSTQSNQVDIGAFPQQLITRVDIVTGGASAAYGSDALSGVVNFVLDKEFVGLKGEVSGGITSYGDDQDWKVTLAGGTAFGGGRGHFLVSGEISKRLGILGDLSGTPNKREWFNGMDGILSNPAYTKTNGQPQYIVRPNVAASAANFGGIITSGPLKGTAFGPGGTPYQFNYGQVAGVYMSGGDYQTSDVTGAESLDPKHTHQTFFTRASYDITDNINVYASVSWDHTWHESYFGVSGELNTLVMKSDNAYIPATVASQLNALKITQFTFGSWVDGLHEGSYNERWVNRYVFGGSGKFDAFDDAWSWDAYYQKGVTRASENSLGNKLKPVYAQAIDAVVDPATGRIVCRSTLTNPTNGCLPFNVFGKDVATAAARLALVGNHFFGNSYRYEHFSQDVMAANVRGEPFSSWAGPISVALGVEHRTESSTGIVDANSLAGNWYAANYRPTIGSYNVTEGFAETVIPLAKDQVWAKSLDLNAAVRGTSYSTSGYVTTWKVGATWDLIDDIRLRATRSRDIRAPNIGELFTSGIRGLTYVIDPFTGNPNTQAETITTGNLALKPEVADTTGIGIVLQPTFFPGFSASVDYYNIDISQAIGTVGTQQTIDNCFSGNTVFCSGIQRDVVNGVLSITKVFSQPFNFVNELNRGIDFEASYNLHLADVIDSWNGALSFRVLATNFLKNRVSNGVNKPTDQVGQNGGGNNLPRWKYTASLAYTGDAISAVVTGRGVSAGVFNTSYIQCSSGCPTATTDNPTIDNNFVAGAMYFDTNLTYKIR
ncbi:MAG: TonB-dependent receptor plug domain-containing protein, partial [Rhodospirillaceae bacterium]